MVLFPEKSYMLVTNEVKLLLWNVKLSTPGPKEIEAVVYEFAEVIIHL